MSSPVTEKTQWNAKVEAHRLFGDLGGLAARFEANNLDSVAVKKAQKAIAELAAEVQQVYDAAAAKERSYRASVGSGGGVDVEALKRENEELKKRLAVQPTR